MIVAKRIAEGEIAAKRAVLRCEDNGYPALNEIIIQSVGVITPEPDSDIRLIAPHKDVDGLTVANAGKNATGDFESGLISCTAAGAMALIDTIHGSDLSGLNAVVIGRSNLFGKPMGLLPLAANETVTMAHSKTKDLTSVCRSADILVAAVGRPEIIRAVWVKPGATVIDVGINRIAAPEKGEDERGWSATSLRPCLRSPVRSLPYQEVSVP